MYGISTGSYMYMYFLKPLRCSETEVKLSAHFFLIPDLFQFSNLIDRDKLLAKCIFSIKIVRQIVCEQKTDLENSSKPMQNQCLSECQVVANNLLDNFASQTRSRKYILLTFYHDQSVSEGL